MHFEEGTLLTLGDYYRVVWDGQEYDVNTSYVENSVVIGNVGALGFGEVTGEPFIIMTIPGAETAFVAFDESTSHNIAIYRIGVGTRGEAVLEEKTYDGFESYGPVVYGKYVDFELTEGQIYRIVWDGQEYVSAALTKDVNGTILTFIGNAELGGVDTIIDTGEPFLMANNPNGDGMISTADTATSHTIGIYKNVISAPSGDKLILAEQVLDGFEEQTNLANQPMYTKNIDLRLTEGKLYKVIWDNEEYVVDSFYANNTIVMGNIAVLYGSYANTNEPFVIGNAEEGAQVLTNESGSHTISIYEVCDMTVVLAKKACDRFAYDSNWGAYAQDIAMPYTFVVGNTYRVMWDGVAYDCVAQDASFISSGLVALGNGSAFGLSGNNEPFVIGCIGKGATLLALDGAAESHVVAIYSPTSNLGEVVLAEQTVSVEYYEPEQNYIGYFENPPILVVGETYIVILDGVQYECTALDFSSLMVEGAVGLNFNDGWGIVTYDGQAAIMINDTEPTTHSVAIYKVAGGNGGSDLG